MTSSKVKAKRLKISSHLMDNYQNYYEHGDSEWRWLGAIDKARNIQALCSELPIGSVIEIGAGEGSILKRLSDLEFAQDYWAVEISPTGVKAIENRNIPNLQECVLFDGYHVPYDDKRFDLAVLSHVIEHVEYPRKLLYEARRIARYVFVEVPLEDNRRLPPDFQLDEVGHINFYSARTIRRLIQTCNLQVLDQRLTNPSKDVYVFQKGRIGLVNFYLKEYLLKLFPALATANFTFHSSILCSDIHESRAG